MKEASDALTRWQAGLGSLLLTMAWLVSDHYPPWTNFHGEVLAAAGGAVLVVYALTRRSAEGPVPALTAILLVWALVPWLQWLCGLVRYAGDAALASLYLIGAALSLWAGGAIPAQERRQLLNAFVAVALISALLGTGIALYQTLDLGFLQIWVAKADSSGRATGNVGQSNHFATLLCFGLASIVLLHARRTIGPATAILSAAFIFIGLALSQSRSPWLQALVLVCWMVARRDGLLRPLRIRAGAAMGLALWYGALFWLAPTMQALASGGGPAAAVGRLYAGSRPVIWAQWLAAIEARPWFGYGWQQGDAAQAFGALTHPGREYTGGFGHNAVLDLLIWNGLPLGLLLTGALAWWYLRIGRGANGPEQWFRLAIISAVFAHSMVEYPYAYAYFLIPLALMGGQLDAESGATPRIPVPRVALVCLFVAIAGAGIAVIADYLRIEQDTRDLRAELFHIGGVRKSEPPADILILDQMLASARAARIVVRPDMPAAEIEDLLQVSRRFPTRFFLQQSAVALALNGRLPEGDAQMKRLAGIYGRSSYLRVLDVLDKAATEKEPKLRPFVDHWRAAVPA